MAVYLAVLLITVTTLPALLVHGRPASNDPEPASGLDPNALNGPTGPMAKLQPAQMRRLRRDTGAVQPQLAAPAHIGLTGGQEPTRNGKKPHLVKRLWTKLRHLMSLKKHFTRLWHSLKRRFSKKKREVKGLEKQASGGDAEAKKDLAEVKRELGQIRGEMKAAEAKATAAEAKATAAEAKATAVVAKISAVKTSMPSTGKVAPAAPKLPFSTSTYKPIMTSSIKKQDEKAYGGGFDWNAL